jgi:hypothetical protein
MSATPTTPLGTLTVPTKTTTMRTMMMTKVGRMMDRDSLGEERVDRQQSLASSQVSVI